MLDYGILATVERFHLVPMRSEFLALPVVASMGSLQSNAVFAALINLYPA